MFPRDCDNIRGGGYFVTLGYNSNLTGLRVAEFLRCRFKSLSPQKIVPLRIEIIRNSVLFLLEPYLGSP